MYKQAVIQPEMEEKCHEITNNNKKNEKTRFNSNTLVLYCIR